MAVKEKMHSILNKNLFKFIYFGLINENFLLIAFLFLLFNTFKSDILNNLRLFYLFTST